METITVPIKRLRDDAQLPAYQSDHAAGMDLHAAISYSITLQPGEIHIVSCGFAIAIPVGYEAQIRPRSGLASKHGISMPNAPGTIDADYRGEVRVPLVNLGREAFTITQGMRIAQMMVKPVPRTAWQEVDELPDSRRGGGGFGHTGA